MISFKFFLQSKGWSLVLAYILCRLVQGVDFHKFYFDNFKPSAMHVTLSSPKVQMLSSCVASIAYTVLVQHASSDKAAPVTSSYLESRIWKKQDAQWKCCHVHRSSISKDLMAL